ncbi:MAG: PH domain-containing protein [Nanoarchaeota archaeon]|nr:PH domain-containing protein [Nanoarchaeota archaeon]
MAEEKLLFELDPNAINALLPTILKNLFYLILILIPIIIIIFLINLFFPIELTYLLIIASIMILAIFIIPIIIEIKTILKIYATSYKFYKTHIVVVKKIFGIKTNTVPYSKITNINTEISFWDRIVNCGDIILYTAEQSEEGNIKLLYIKDPVKMEKKIHNLILSHKKS